MSSLAKYMTPVPKVEVMDTRPIEALLKTKIVQGRWSLTFIVNVSEVVAIVLKQPILN